MTRYQSFSCHKYPVAASVEEYTTPVCIKKQPEVKRNTHKRRMLSFVHVEVMSDLWTVNQ
ncbi:CLUMA_CG001866, isoform A [Clunio marinus]|uniref:CLUMA_CG001866, isoform A n=1 Tax=Clunio marinus TaxID=568069 RepID=A0A1J1HPD8_9DIPT|nr:CLUMA_CG001866, isoform A [Clunio marinus]